MKSLRHLIPCASRDYLEGTVIRDGISKISLKKKIRIQNDWASCSGDVIQKQQRSKPVPEDMLAFHKFSKDNMFTVRHKMIRSESCMSQVFRITSLAK